MLEKLGSGGALSPFRPPADAALSRSETYLQAAAVGFVGATLEDATPGSRKDKPLFDIGEATERVAAAVEATRKLGSPFLLTARAEGFLRGNTDLEDAIKRLQAYKRGSAAWPRGRRDGWRRAAAHTRRDRPRRIRSAKNDRIGRGGSGMREKGQRLDSDQMHPYSADNHGCIPIEIFRAHAGQEITITLNDLERRNGQGNRVQETWNINMTKSTDEGRR